MRMENYEHMDLLKYQIYFSAGWYSGIYIINELYYIYKYIYIYVYTHGPYLHVWQKQHDPSSYSTKLWPKTPLVLLLDLLQGGKLLCPSGIHFSDPLPWHIKKKGSKNRM